MSQTQDPGVAGLISTFSHTFVESDHKIISSHSPPSTDSRRVVVNKVQNYVHEVMVNSLVKLAQEKVLLGELTVLTLP